MVENKIAKYTGALVVLTSLFFMWGFITCMNDILIPFLRKVFELSRGQSMLVQFAFFIAYFVGSVVYFLISKYSGDPIVKIGYKKGIILGLLVSALGCGLFFPAAEIKVYGLFLVALFILGLGFTLLQIAANPYVAILGPPDTASSRLNLSQAFNSLGTTIAPIFGGYLVFNYFAKLGQPLLNKLGNPILTDTGQPISSLGVQLPYIIFASVFILLAVIIGLTKLPKFNTDQTIEKGGGALKHKHLVLGMVAIFMYVGSEVSVGSLFINYAHELVAFPEMKAKSFLAFYWGGAMIGRFIGAISLSKMENKVKQALYMLGVAIAAFLVIYFAVYEESDHQIHFMDVAPFVGFIVANFLAFLLGKSSSSRTLMIFSLVIIGLLSATMLTSGLTALWCIIGIGLFNSIMWSNIFTLAIEGLGKYTSQGSSLLVMMILGGAILPFLQGTIADAMNGYHYSFFLPILAYLYLVYYGWKGHKIKTNTI